MDDIVFDTSENFISEIPPLEISGYPNILSYDGNNVIAILSSGSGEIISIL